jgi:hypothetical protein
MKTPCCLLLTSALLGQVHAQTPSAPRNLTAQVIEETETTEPGTPGTVTRTVVEETITPAPRRLDPALTLRQLAIAPRALPVEPALVVPPGAKVETTETKTIVKHPGLPPSSRSPSSIPKPASTSKATPAPPASRLPNPARNGGSPNSAPRTVPT